MKINLSPIASTTSTEIEIISENQIRHNNETYDFSSLPNGSEVQAESPAIGKITKDENGVIELTIHWFYNSESDNTHYNRFPAPIVASSGIFTSKGSNV